MKVLYLTTSIRPEDFSLLEEKAQIKPNPAGQNFHQRLIHTLNGFVSLEVVSLLPDREGILQKGKVTDGVISYTYVTSRKSKVARAFFGPKDICAAASKADIIVYDSLSLTLAKASQLIASRQKIQRVAVCTDSPFNLTGTDSFYQKQVISLSSSADGYFCLTNGLNTLFNPANKPNLIKPGIAEEAEQYQNPHPRPYFYYGGALFVKDGTKALIEAYQSSNAAYDLVIAGHGNYEAEVARAAASDPRIRFLGQISKKKNAAYEANASLLINPRLYREDLDDTSVPSKVIEYLTLGSAIVSTRSKDLQTLFPEDINWLDSGEGLLPFLNSHLDENGKLKGIKPNNAQQKVLDILGFEEIGRSFTGFLQNLIQK